MVPVVRWHMVTEQKTEQVPVTVCRMVNQVIYVKVPRMVIHCEPKQLIYKTAVLTCEEVPVTVYRPVTRMVPVVFSSGQSLAQRPGRSRPVGPGRSLPHPADDSARSTRKPCPREAPAPEPSPKASAPPTGLRAANASTQA